ncbi:hypothetical protein AB4Y45_32815 [Paraburkholderia sp. EG287A]|uniref:hypothetical protein n=1 Tax=Paraburkholderia sp. EG287A TaxID=3237012 RepID=UPI0034D1B172
MKFCSVEIPSRLFELTREHIRTLSQFTVDDLRTHLLDAGRTELAICNGLQQNWPLIANRVLRAVIRELEDAGDIDHIRRGVWARMRKLTDIERAIICTIHQTADYRFLGPELSGARRLAKDVYLKEGTDKHFTVTAAGELVYKRRAAQ